MAKQVQWRRGTTAENNAYTGVDGELTIDTETYGVRVHDGVTAGGHALDLIDDALRADVDAVVALKAPLANPTFTGRVIGPLMDQGGVEYTVESYRLGGAVSDTTAAQAAIAAANAAGGGVVRFSARTYETTGISLENMTGVILRGSGWANMYTQGSKLRYTGSSGGTLLNMNGARYCSVEFIGLFANASVEGTTSTAYGVRALGNPTYNGCFFNHFRNCYFQNFSTGADLGLATDQVDTFTFEKCWWYYGESAIGIKVNSSNSLSVQLINCTFSEVNNGSSNTSTAVHVATGSVKMFGCITANNLYGVRIAATPTANIEIYGQHAEGDNYPIYTDATGNHQKAYTVIIDGFFSYLSGSALFYFGNANLLYEVRGVRSTPSGGNDDIIVPVNCEEVFLQSVTHFGTVKDTDGTAVSLPGYYGAQGVSRWHYRLPEYTRISPSGTAIRSHLAATAALDFGSIAAQATAVLTVTVTGVANDGTWEATACPVGTPETGLVWCAWVSGTDTVSVRLANVTAGAIDPASRSYRVSAWKH